MLSALVNQIELEEIYTYYYTVLTRGLRANLGGISIYQQTNACKPIILKYINIKT